MIIKGETIGTITEWHEETFPDATEEGQHSKWDEEIYEVMHARGKKKLEELADLYIVACGLRRWNTEEFNERIDYISGIASRNGWEAKELWDAVCKKMKKNRRRIWKKSGNGKFHHVSKEEPIVVPARATLEDLAELERSSRFRAVTNNATLSFVPWDDGITIIEIDRTTSRPETQEETQTVTTTSD